MFFDIYIRYTNKQVPCRLSGSTRIPRIVQLESLRMSGGPWLADRGSPASRERCPLWLRLVVFRSLGLIFRKGTSALSLSFRIDQGGYMDKDKMVPQKLGINGLGRIAKLSIWHHVERRYFSELVINIGREVGTRIEDIAHFVEHDSTYGALHNYLYGARAKRVIEQLDEKSGSFVVNGVKATLLRQARNPAQIGWRSHGVDLVVDATGAFLDPTAPADDSKGSPGATSYPAPRR